MSPVDSVRPPKRAKKIPIKTGVGVQSKTAATEEVMPPSDPVGSKSSATPPPASTPQKQKTIVMVVVVIMALIFIGWVALFSSGKLTRSKASNFGSILSNQLQNLWQNIKTDILKIKNLNQNTNTTNVNDEQIKKLENSVFPQFNDPTKQ